MSDSLNNYHFVIATPHSKEYFQQNCQISLFLDKFSQISKTTHTVIYDNKEGLSKIYNSFITEENRDKNIIFAHDDLLIDDIFLEEKLTIAFEKYDIVGLAGAKKCQKDKNIMAWHLMCDRSELAGEVAHSKDKNHWTTIFGPTDSRVLILDGLFLAVKTAKLLDTNTKFDEDFTFHHYDMSFCLRANANKLKMGVYPIKVTHFGMGDSMNSQLWEQSAQKFKQKYIL